MLDELIEAILKKQNVKYTIKNFKMYFYTYIIINTIVSLFSLICLLYICNKMTID